VKLKQKKIHIILNFLGLRTYYDYFENSAPGLLFAHVISLLHVKPNPRIADV
jgi:hypothetical protein